MAATGATALLSDARNEDRRTVEVRALHLSPWDQTLAIRDSTLPAARTTFHAGLDPMWINEGTVLLLIMISMEAAPRRRRLRFIIRHPAERGGLPSAAADVNVRAVRRWAWLFPAWFLSFEFVVVK
jgi:hypothetical protein